MKAVRTAVITMATMAGLQALLDAGADSRLSGLTNAVSQLFARFLDPSVPAFGPLTATTKPGSAGSAAVRAADRIIDALPATVPAAKTGADAPTSEGSAARARQANRIDPPTGTGANAPTSSGSAARARQANRL